MKIFNNVSLIFACIGGFIFHYLGGNDSLLKAIINLIIIDYISGLIKALYNKKISSNVGFKGIIKKVMILLIIATTVVIENIIATEIPIREVTIMFFISNEGISILENASEFVNIPKILKDFIEKLRGNNNV